MMSRWYSVKPGGAGSGPSHQHGVFFESCSRICAKSLRPTCAASSHCFLEITRHLINMSAKSESRGIVGGRCQSGRAERVAACGIHKLSVILTFRFGFPSRTHQPFSEKQLVIGKVVRENSSRASVYLEGYCTAYRFCTPYR